MVAQGGQALADRREAIAVRQPLVALPTGADLSSNHAEITSIVDDNLAVRAGFRNPVQTTM